MQPVISVHARSDARLRGSTLLEIQQNLYLSIISPVRLLQKKRTTFIFRNCDHSKATFTFDELLPRRHLLQIGNETKIIAGSKDISSKVCRDSQPTGTHRS